MGSIARARRRVGGRPVKAQLFVLNGPDVGKSFELAHGHRAGRSPECEIVLRHASISRRHAHFEREDGERQDGAWYVVDDGSRNGVIVDKQRVERAKLFDAQEFQLGELELRFRLLEAESAPASPQARAPHGAAAATPVASKTDDDADEILLEGGDDEPEPAPV